MELLNRKQYYKIWASDHSGLCVFCEVEQIVLQEFKYWKWVAAIAPYWKYQTMLYPKRHISTIDEMSDKEWEEFKKIQSSIIEVYRSKNPDIGGDIVVFWRDRLNIIDPILNSTYHKHLHVHFLYDLGFMFDPIADPEAHLWDVDIFKESVQ